MDEVMRIIKSSLNTLPASVLIELRSLLSLLGVESVEDVSLVSEEDLSPLLKKGVTLIQIRKILRVIKDMHKENLASFPSSSEQGISLSAPDPAIAVPLQPLKELNSSNSSTPSTNWAQELRFKPQDFSASIRMKIKGTVRLSKSERNQLVRDVCAKVHSIVKKPGRKALRLITANLVETYPVLQFVTYTGRKIKSSNAGLLGCIEARIETMNRPTDSNHQTEDEMDDPQPNKPTAARKKDKYGCLDGMYCPSNLPKDETKQTQENSRMVLLDMWKSERPKDWNMISNLMDVTYASQRWFITIDSLSPNESKSTAEKLSEQWPFLFEPRVALQHMKTLTGVDFKENLREFIANEVTDFIQFLIANAKEKAADFVKIKREMDSWKDCGFADIEIVCFLKMLCLYFGEDFSLFMRTEEPTILASEVDTSSLPVSPVIIALGGSVFSAHRFLFAFENMILNEELHTGSEAISLTFAIYFNVHLLYPKDICFSLEFIQRYIAHIDPEEGNKRDGRKGRAANSVSNKVLTLMEKFDSFKRDLSDQ